MKAHTLTLRVDTRPVRRALKRVFWRGVIVGAVVMFALGVIVGNLVP